MANVNCVLVLVPVIVKHVVGCSSMITHFFTMKFQHALMATTQPQKVAGILNATTKGVQKRMSAVRVSQAIAAGHLLAAIAILDVMTHAGCT